MVSLVQIGTGVGASEGSLGFGGCAARAEGVLRYDRLPPPGIRGTLCVATPQSSFPTPPFLSSWYNTSRITSGSTIYIGILSFLFRMLGPIGIFVFFVLFKIFGLAVATAATIPDRDYLQQQIPASDLLRDPILDMYLLEGFRQRQASTHFITDCVYVTSKAGYFIFKSPNDDPTVCGVYFLTDPDRQVELRFTFFDVPCERGGLASVVDGWELNGEVFPSATDHPLPIDERVSEFCGKRVKKVFLSSQNAALIQYRIPAKGKGFTVLARYPKQSTPCNVLVDSTADVFTLRNYGRRVNCTLSAMYPAAIRVIALGVGINTLHGTSHEIETGTVHKCDKRGLQDQAQIGGSGGLDTTKLEILDSICGVDSKPDTSERIVGCGVTSVRLTSSGLFDNSVTVTIRPAMENDIMEADLICGV